MEQSASFPGRSSAVERVFAAGEVTRFPRSFTRFSGTQAFLDNSFCISRILIQPVGEFLSDNRLNDAFDFAVAEFRFRLSFKLRLRDLDTDDSGESFPEIIAGKGDLVLFDKIVLVAVVVQRAGKRSTKSDKMRSAFSAC